MQKTPNTSYNTCVHLDKPCQTPRHNESSVSEVGLLSSFYGEDYLLQISRNISI